MAGELRTSLPTSAHIGLCLSCKESKMSSHCTGFLLISNAYSRMKFKHPQLPNKQDRLGN